MYKNTFKSIQKIVAGTLITVLLALSIPAQTYAIIGIADQSFVTVVGDVSATGIMNNINHQMDRLKNFVLDRLATVIAKQILHQLTMSVVNWINSGFKGSPAFLTNPEAFFLDVADQVTGAFLATNGPLSTLCSPFSIDIRLSLALNQTNLTDQRYECTLSKIIEAQKNGPEIIVNGQVVRSANGTMNGFLGGDFNQGGWPAFIELTTVPQNNPYDAFLTAQGDLYAKLDSRKNVIRADLQLGQGFMSWESCKDVPGGTNIDLNSQAGIDSSTSLANGPGRKQVQNPNGTVTYQQCETQTPGSVIAGTLQTNLNVPVVELELANDINAIINALVTQMVSTMLSSGLHALSSGSGGEQAYTQQVISDANSMKDYQGSLDIIHSEISSAIDKVYGYIAIYEQSISLVKDSQNRYLAAQSCFKAKLASPTARMYDPEYLKVKISSIDSTISIDIVPLLKSLNKKYDTALEDQTALENISDSLSGTGSPDQIKIETQKYTEFVQNGGLIIQPKIDAAQTTLTTTQTQVQTFNNDAQQLLIECNSTQ